MSEFFKAAAHCDITVVRKAPIHINEKAIIEEEIAARQWDTLAEKVAMEQDLRQQVRNAELEQIRQREQEERMRKLRLEERRKEAIQQKEAEREAKHEVESRKHEDLETQRLAAIEEKRMEMQAEREQSRIKAQEKAYEEVQKRLLRAAEQNAGRFSEQELPEDDAAITYMTRLRVEKDRLGRADKLFSGNGISAVYSNTSNADDGEGGDAASRKTQLERDIMARREAERARLQREIDEIHAEESAVADFENAQRLATAEEKLREHTGWLRAYKEEQEELERIRLENAPQPQGKHIIDVLHETVRAEFMREQEAEALLEENLRDGGSHLERLEHYLEAEKDAWREQRQYEHEVDKEAQEYIE